LAKRDKVAGSYMHMNGEYIPFASTAVTLPGMQISLPVVRTARRGSNLSQDEQSLAMIVSKRLLANGCPA